MNKKALITGITGQDGSYLAELLLGKGYIVHGVVRRTSSLGRSRLKHLFDDPAIYGKTLFLHYADLDDPTTFRRVLDKVRPDEIYHLAGQSHVGLSFEIPESTCEMTAMATLRLLEMLRDLPAGTRFYHASSSEIFGSPAQVPQDESTPFAPVNPYGCAKAFATQMGAQAIDRVIQAHGAMGMTTERGLTEAWQSLRKVNIADGSNEILRRTIFKELLDGDTDW